MIAGRTRERVKPLIQAINRRLPGKRLDRRALKRREPFSDCFGWDRGLPLDRFYIERFLAENRRLIRGSTMEIRSSEYVERFGGDQVERVEVVDIDPGNRRATLTADLRRLGSLPTSAYDCVVLTQTLHYLSDDAAALVNLWNSLKPGGSLLLTVPCTTRVDNESPESDFWRYTPAGLEHRLRTTLPPRAMITTRGFGNAPVAVAFLMGIAVEEVDRETLEHSDSRFPVVSCAVVRKPVGANVSHPGRAELQHA